MRSDAPELSPDFADRVVRQVVQVRRRRRMARTAVLVVGLAGVASWIGSTRRAPAPASPALVASDFEWLEEVGTGTSTPASLLFPDERSPEENLLVTVAERQ